MSADRQGGEAMLNVVTRAIVAVQDRLHPMWPSPRDYALAALAAIELANAGESAEFEDPDA